MIRLNNFDFLRLIFASLVVISHTNYLAAGGIQFPLFFMAEDGVDGFFLITGYLIYFSAERSPNVSSYLIRRISRIYPAYFTVLVIQVGLLLILSSQPVALQTVNRYIAVNALFLNWLQPTFGDGVPIAINGSLWTLKIEIAFYTFAPFLVMLVRRYGGGILIGLLAASVIFNFGMTWFGYDKIGKQAPGMLYLFIIGMTLRRFHNQDISGVSPWWWLPAAMLFVGLMILKYLDNITDDRWHFPIHVVEVSLLAGFVYIAALKAQAIKIPLDISYGIYLWHFPVIQVLLACGFATLAFPLLMIVVCALTLSVAIVSAMTVERWGIQFGKVFGRRLERRSGHRLAGLVW